MKACAYNIRKDGYSTTRKWSQWFLITMAGSFSKSLSVSLSVCLQAKEYFEMDGFVTDHIEILQDHSALFRALAFFEDDLERRCKMHKRRVDMLEPICNGTT